MERKAKYFLIGLAILILVILLLIFLPIWPNCGGSTFGAGQLPDCHCLGLKKSTSFLWGVDKCVGIRTQCYLLPPDSIGPSLVDMSQNDNTNVQEVKDFLTKTRQGYPYTGNFKVEKLKEPSSLTLESCSGEGCNNNSTLVTGFFKYNIGVDCKYYDEQLAKILKIPKEIHTV